MTRPAINPRSRLPSLQPLFDRRQCLWGRVAVEQFARDGGGILAGESGAVDRHAGNPPIHQRVGELDARHHAGGTEPGLAGIFVSVGRFLAIERLAHVGNLLDQREGVGGVDVQGARSADHHLQRRLDLGLARGFGEELARREHGFHHGAQIAIGLDKCTRHVVDEGRRRIVGHEAPRELGGNETRRGRMAGQDVDHLQAILLAAARGDRCAEHRLFRRIVHEGGEREFGLLVRLANRPAGEAARHRDHVLLGVAAVHSQGVELQQFAAVVLVQAVRLARQLLGRSERPGREGSDLKYVGRHGLPVVQVEKHGRMTRSGQQKVLEFAQHVRPDGIALIARQHGAHAVLALEDVEVVEPEIGQHLFQLPVRIERAIKLGFAQIADHHLLRRAQHHAHAPQFGLAGKRVGGQRAGKPLEFVGIQGGEESGSLGRRSAQRYLHLLRRQQFVERRPHAPHFHLAGLPALSGVRRPVPSEGPAGLPLRLVERQRAPSCVSPGRAP